MHVREIFCGLAQSFDCVNREILLTKLQSYGIQDQLKIGSCPFKLAEDKKLK
jgi:hypothetical protein